MMPHRLTRGAILDRDSVLVEAARGRSVLHLGCADAPYFRSRAANGTLLHARLCAVARHITGVDISEEGVSFLRDDLGFKNVLLGDVEALSELGLGRTYDLVVAGELLEHLPNPGLCLTGTKNLVREEGSLLVTVPNAFSIKGLMRLAGGVELVHPDHVSYFSLVTVRRLLERCGYAVVSSACYVSSSGSRFKRTLDALVLGPVRKFAPHFSDGIIVEAVVIR